MKGQLTHPATKEMILKLYYESEAMPTKKAIADALGMNYGTVVDIINREKITESYLRLVKEWDEVTDEIKVLAGWIRVN
ncbi:hypothetical protein [Diplocloster hominis]|uniref:hypothetical protein n=1 Tax=Diplocloster hominis TaxID=3079010 RepID=UPI0031BB6389